MVPRFPLPRFQSPRWKTPFSTPSAV